MENKINKRILIFENKKQKEIARRDELLAKSQIIIDECDYKLRNLNIIKKEFEKINKKAKEVLDKIEGGNTNDTTRK